MHNKRYDEIISSIPAWLDRQVMHVLSQHVGRENAISRKELVKQVFGRDVDNLSNNSDDRQIRNCIADLQRQYLIISDSSSGGYYIPATKVEADEYVAEIVSRARELEMKASALRDLACSKFGQAHQPGLL